MVSFGWYNMPRSLKPGEKTKIGFRVYNNTDEDLAVTVDVYQRYPSLKYLGQVKFTAYKKSTTNYTSSLTFTMPPDDVQLHAEFKAVGKVTGKTYTYGSDRKISVKGSGVDIDALLLQELKRWYKKNVTVPGVTEYYDWSFDVTSLVKQVYPEVEKAYLYGRYEIVSSVYAGKTRPADRPVTDIVKGWEQGYERALLYLGRETYPELANYPDYEGWYWAYVPCKLIKTTGNQTDTTTCTKEQFRNGMVNNFKNSPQTVGWVNQYSPIVDVTQLVKQVYPDAQKAFLVIYGDDLSKIRVQGGYTSQPSPLPYSQIVYNWRVLGEEWERQYCSSDGKYYWVIYPCKVFIFRKFDITPSKTTLSPGESFSVNGTVEHITTQGKSVSFEFGVTPSWDSVLRKTTKTVTVLRKTTKTVTGTGSWQTTTLSASLLAPTSRGSYSISAYLKVGL